MSDSIDPRDTLGRAIELLREPVAMASGLPERTEGRRIRQRRTGRAMRGITLALSIVVVSLLVRGKASGTTVTFTIAAPNGHSVALVGDFNDWRADRLMLEPDGSGIWHATVKLPPGQYRYAYVIDRDQWRAESTTGSAPDDFGRPTSVLMVRSN